MKIKKMTIVKSLAAAFILIFLATCIPKKIDFTLPAVQYSYDDPDYLVQTSITMKGKLSTPLFMNAKYTGTCIIEGYDFTEEYRLIDMEFRRDMDDCSILSYSTLLPDGSPDINLIGQMGMTGNFDSICILGRAPEDVKKSGELGLVIISAPAETKEEAIEIGIPWLEAVYGQYADERYPPIWRE